MDLDLDSLEELAFHPDRDAALAELMPGTEEHDYYRCVHLQQRGQLAEAQKIIDEWPEQHGSDEELEVLRLRQLLARLSLGADDARAEVRDTFGANHWHEPEAATGASPLPSKLAPGSFDGAALLREALRVSADLSQVTEEGYYELLEGDYDLDDARRRALLDRLSHTPSPRLVPLVLRELDGKELSRFGKSAVHRALTLDQLGELAQRSQALSRHAEWVNQVVQRLRPPAHVDLDQHGPERLAYLRELWRFCEGLGAPFASLKLHAASHLLDELRRLPAGAGGGYDRALFVTYLSLPRQTDYTGDRWDKVASDHHASFGVRFPTGLSPVDDDQELVRDYLYALLAGGDAGDDLGHLLERTWFERERAEIRLLAGAPEPERWTRVLTPAHAQQLQARVEIELAKDNPQRLGQDQPLALTLDVKNVEQLLIKVFRIDPAAYFAVHGKSPEADLDLDGLAASHEEVRTFSEPPVRRVRRVLELPQCSRPGCYVIDLIGNGKSSRAMVWKGALRLAQRTTAAGAAVTVFDEVGRARPSARLLLGSRELTADADGVIWVPFSTNPGSTLVMLVDGDLATTATLTQLAEDYALRVSAHVEREALAADRLARAVVRVELLVAGAPAPISLLRNPSWDLALTDRQGAVTKRSAPLTLDDDRCAVLEWKMPQDVASVALSVRGKVEVVSRSAEVEVSGSLGAELAVMHAGPYTEAAYLARTEAGYVLSALGKSGEPRARQRLPLWITHRWARTQLTVSLDTDDDGRAELGGLPQADSVQTHFAGMSFAWRLAARGPGAQVVVLEGDAVVVPPPTGVTAQELIARASLVELRANLPFRHHQGALAIEGQNLVVRGLGAGEFHLRAPQLEPWAITVLPAATPRVLDHALVGDRSYELVPAPAAIDRLELGADELTVCVRGATASTRVHVLATRFLPAPALGTLERPRRPAQWQRRAPSRDASYQSGRELGDEVRYVLDRRGAQRRPGLMLEKPSLLLNPWARKATTTELARAGAGGRFASASAPRPAMAPAPAKPQASAVQSESFATFDFVPGDAVLLGNLRPDADGRVRIPRAELGGHPCVQVVCVDREAATRAELALPETKLAPRDRRLARALPPEAHVTERRQIDPCPAGGAVTIRDLATARVHVIDTVARAHAYLLSLREEPGLRELEFVTRWHQLGEAERAEKVSKHACHELHLFLYFRDRPYFARVIAPFLAQKRVKTFLDHWLLGDDLTAYLEPRELAERNAVERALLALRLPDRPALARQLDDEVAMLPPDPDRDARLVEVMLAGAALDDDSGLQALADARSKEHAADLELADEATDGFAPAAPSFGAIAPMMMTMAGAMPPPAPTGGMPAKAKKAMRQREEKAEERESSESAKRDQQVLQSRGAVQRLFRTAEKTQEWAEHNWWRRRPEECRAHMITPSRLWRDLARHREGPFLSGALGLATGSLAEAMCALAVLDLPFEAPPHRLEEEGGALTIHAACNALVASSQLVPAELTAELPLIVGQSYLRNDDRHHLVEGEYVQKFVSGPLVAGVIYACQVVVANPTGTQQRVSVLVQIPRGAVPTTACKATRTFDVVLPPYAAHGLEVAFYFPRPGAFGQFGAHVARRGVPIASAPGATLQVIAAGELVDASSWAHVSQHGSLEQVLAMLRAANLGGLELTKVAWRLRDAAAYRAILEVLEERLAYHPALWGYALWHGDRPRIRRWLRTNDRLVQAGPVLDMDLVGLDAEELGLYEHLEFAPLINARAHRLGGVAKILNDGLSKQLTRFLTLVAHRRAPTADDHLVAAHYLFAQDRFDEAHAHLERAEAAGAAQSPARLQHDYLRAYSACARGELGEARARATPHLTQPIDRWRERFAALVAMLDEVAGAAAAVVDERSREQVQATLAAKQPAFELAVDAAGVELTWQELGALELRYFAMDIELLFSRQPFVQADVSRFSFIEPGHRQQVTLTTSPQRVEWPASMRGKNVVVEAVAAGLRKTKVHYAHDLRVVVAQQWGQVRVTRASTHKPAVAAYVKAYARRDDGSVVFFKDGYTDLRGWFDYASLSTDDLDHATRFAILVNADDAGATIVEAEPPPR